MNLFKSPYSIQNPELARDKHTNWHTTMASYNANNLLYLTDVAQYPI